jgi:hypothetical protein
VSDACCELPRVPAESGECPESGAAGKPVDWLTVAALVEGHVPPRQDFWLCRDPDCAVVYFGEQGSLLTAEDLRVAPGFKNGSSGLVCYCFSHHRDDIARDLSERGETSILESIKKEVQAGNCACEVRNPAGKCCLGEVQRAISELSAELEVTT